ncbi:MAG: universal stress protein [Acidimicrobiia bacterium]
MTGEVVTVGVDASEGSVRALRWALREARLRGARLRAVLAWSYLDQPKGSFDPAYGEDDARGQLDEALALVAGGADDVEIDPVLVNDLPARALLAAARDADLLVVGSRGLGGFKGLLLGSVSQQVVQHAPCPVVVVPGDERPASRREP